MQLAWRFRIWLQDLFGASGIGQYLAGWRRVIRFARIFRPLRGKALAANGCGALSGLLQLTIPLASVSIINEALPHKNVKQLIVLSVSMAVAAVASIGLSFLEFYYASVFRERAAMSLQKKLFEHIQAQPFLFFKNNDSGYVMSRIITDGTTSLDIVGSITTFGKSVVWLLAGVVLLPYFNMTLGLTIAAFMPVYLCVLILWNRRTKEAWSEVSEKTALASRELFESLSGIYETKAFGAHKYRSRRYTRALIDQARISIKSRVLTATGGQVAQVSTLLISLIVITYGGWCVIGGRMSLGAVIGMNAIAAYVLLPVNRLVEQSLRAQQSIAAIERVEDVLSLRGEELVDDCSGKPRVLGSIRFENVAFEYCPEVQILQNVNFELLAGEAALILGPSGIGKTTLVNLLPRFIEPIAGSIYLDEQPIIDLPLSYLRRQLAYVSQDVFLFSDTVFSNIKVGNLAASDEEVYEAARLANALEFIERLPDKFNTGVGERGAKLSGGQRQRIAIARALVRNAPVLILDEATSAVDPETEFLVHEALSHLMKNRTTIIIAHHADAFIERVNRIFVLDHGCLTEDPVESKPLAESCGSLMQTIGD